MVNPRTRYFCMTMAKAMTGVEINRAAAPIAPHCVPYSVRKPRIASGAVAARELVNISANRNSFHAAMKTKTPVATIPPMASGSMMRRSTPSSLQPSTIWQRHLHAEPGDPRQADGNQEIVENAGLLLGEQLEENAD